MRYIWQLACVVIFAFLAGAIVGFFGLNPEDKSLIKYAYLIPTAVLGYWLGGRLHDRFSRSQGS